MVGNVAYFPRSEIRPADPADLRIIAIELQGICLHFRDNAPRTGLAGIGEHRLLDCHRIGNLRCWSGILPGSKECEGQGQNSRKNKSTSDPADYLLSLSSYPSVLLIGSLLKPIWKSA